MSVPSILNSKIYHAQAAWKAVAPEYHIIGHCIDNIGTKNRMCSEIAEVSNTIQGGEIATKRGKFTTKGMICLKKLLEQFNLGSTATWDDLFKAALEKKKLKIKGSL